MMFKASWISTAALVFAVGCGSRHGPTTVPNDGGDTDGGGDSDDLTCADDDDCVSGICDGGVCADAPTCVDHHECEAAQYCYFENPPSPWVDGSEGTCAFPCVSTDDCSLGQTCQSGRCYSNVDCNPAENNADCPPGEVCNRQMHTCGAPPAQCNWVEDCPAGWICNVSNKCEDPMRVDLGDCSTDADCATVAGCANNTCHCDAGTCRPRGGCTSAADCGAGNYCENSVCQPANPCPNDDQNACTPYGLVCIEGYCVNPEPCGLNNSCFGGFECHEQETPPKCYPPGTAECVRNEQCPAAEYCELFTNTCEPGCRDNASCAGQCAGATPCNCGSTRQCSSTTVGQTGDACVDETGCIGGTKCVADDPFCALGISGGNCAQSCRATCDLLVSQVQDSCPAGEKCGGSDFASAAINSLVGTLLGGSSSSASICYPASP